ncbi:hypothetical protein EGW08_020720 [Elysia chlorotica]|uniref:Uncharacterized protein n=1 Tax=Elysia chlorotica TaxID=188477 RepID=A0A433SQJ2_ELYCH|nr:hypothetical protein EGW08_020720 [Elysia chlorotica]
MMLGIFQGPFNNRKPVNMKMATLIAIIAITSTSVIVAPALASTSASSYSNPRPSNTPEILDGSYSYFPYTPQGSYESGDPYSSAGADMGGYLSDWNHQDWVKLSGRMHQPKCVEIPRNLSLCQNIGYTRMMLPNLLGHDSLGEVSQQAGSWVHLVNLNCHPDLKVFLCSLFSPVCLDKIIYPCRTLCSSVKASCETRMKTYGFDWPEMLACKQYPEDNDMCIKLIHDIKPDNNCSACKHPLTYESLVDHYCRADVVMRVTVKGTKSVDGDSHLMLRKKKKFFKIKTGKAKTLAQDLDVVIPGGASCTCDTVNGTKQRYLIMGYRSGKQLNLTFAIVWDRSNKEFKKGVRAIRKMNTCEGIFNELSNKGNRLTPTKETKVTTSGRHGRGGKGSRRGKGTRKNGKKNRRLGNKGRKKGGKKSRKTGRKGRNGRKGRKGRKGSKNQRRGEEQSTSRVPDRTALTRREIEDRALSNFRRASE